VDDSTILDKIGREVDLDFMETETKSEATVPRHGMSAEAQRIAIAEACGWTRGKDAISGGESWPVWNKGSQCGSLKTQTLPDYLNDLNAMHEAEKSLTSYDMQSEYFDTLKHSFNLEWTYHATAAQRAEAFLKCIGKWVDAP
jgi:hypothetical protein